MNAQRSIPGAAATLLVVAVAASCTGLSARVARTALAEVPNEELLVLFDAENGVYIARDEAELASRNLQDARAALTKARAYEKTIASRRTSGATIDSVPVLDLLGQWNDSRIAMREAEFDLRELEFATSDTRLWSARARYELEKARLVKARNPAVGTGIELKDFEGQAEAWQALEREAATRVAEKTAVVVAARARYFDLSRQLQQQSGGAYGGPWADLLD
jgi:hypothetical protein